MKKIVLFTNRMTRGGSERVISYLANGLCEKNEVDIVTMTCAPSDYELDSKVHHLPLESKKARNNHSLITNIARIVAFKKYIMSNPYATYVSFVTLPSYILLFFRKRILGKIIVAVRNDPKASHKHKYDKWLVKKLYPKADGIVFQTTEAQDFYNFITIKKPIILPNPINEKFNKAPCTSLGIKRVSEIVNVGRLIDQKNQKLLIDAFYDIHKTIPDYKLVIYGEGYLKNELIQYVKKLELWEKVIIAGSVNDIENKIYHSALFVLSSDFEGMPNALIEAMSLGLPVISTDASGGGPRDIIKNGKNGLLIPVNDKMALETAIMKVLSDEELSESLAKEAHKIASVLSPEAIIKKWELYFDSF